MPEEALGAVDDMNRYFLEHPANAALADHTVFTKDKSPHETCGDILRLL